MAYRALQALSCASIEKKSMLLTSCYISVFLNQSWFPSIKCLLSTEADKEAVQNPDVYLSHVRRFYNVMHFILKVVQLNYTMEK